MRSSHARLVCLLALAVVVALAAPAVAQDKGSDPIARVSMSGNGLSFQPLISADGWTVTVSGPEEFYLRQEFQSGAAVAVYLDTVGVLPDGAYKYELTPVFRMNEADAARLSAARESGDEGELIRQRKALGAREELRRLSGEFGVRNGGILPYEVEEGASGYGLDAAGGSDQDDGTKLVHAADVFIQGSLCVGFDCPSSGSFGFDTIQLRENNLRIKFVDTSSSASFPTNDWEIEANASCNGCSSYFSVDDHTNGRNPFRIEANAPTNALFVEDSGDIGLNTNNPVVELHIKDGDTPTVRLEQDGSSGFTPQTWDLAGNETNFFIRDVTNSSRLPIRSRPGAPTSSIDIAANGNVGFGTASPDVPVHVERNSSNAIVVAERVGTNPSRVLFAAQANAAALGTTDDTAFRLLQNNTEEFRLDNATGNIGIDGVLNPAHPIEHSTGAHLDSAGVWQNGSSREYKTDIQPLNAEEAMAALAELEPVTYVVKKAPEEGRYAGFIAEDVPELVASASRKGMSPMDVVAALTKVVQEQQAQIAELQALVQQLAVRIEDEEENR